MSKVNSMQHPTPTAGPGSAIDIGMEPEKTLKAIQGLVDDWIHNVGVRYFSELTNLAQLMEEVGELARIISRSYGDQSFKEGEKRTDLSDELADILFVVICIANQSGVDLTEAMERNLEKKSARDHHRHQSNHKLRENN